MIPARNVFIATSMLVTLVASSAAAQGLDNPINIGHMIKLPSRVLAEEREVWVYTPPGYEGSSARYPVVYLLDGNAHFLSATSILNHLANNGRVPRMLLVGILNTDRTRDLTPPTQVDTAAEYATAGGAEPFLDFIESELMPYIEGNYRTIPYRVLVGWSLGGLFAVHALAHRPQLFNASIAISPSLWWNGGQLVNEAQDYLSKANLENRFLYFSIGGEENEAMRYRSAGLALQLDLYAPAGLRWSYKVFENETHNSVVHRSIYTGLERMFEDWQFKIGPELAGKDGLRLIQERYKTLSNRFGATIEPSEEVVNNLGYFYIGAKEPATAIKVFEYNVRKFPNSANVHDSLGDAFSAAGKLKKALRSYRKAVKQAEATNHRNLSIYRSNVRKAEAALAAS